MRNVFCHGAFITVIREDQGPFRYYIDNALKGALGSQGQLYGQGTCAQPLPDHVHGAMEIGTNAVHLINEANPGNAIAIRLSPDRLRLGLNASHRIEYHDAPIEDPKAPLHLSGEVHMPRSIDNVDAMVQPMAGSSGRGNGDPPFPFLSHPVHHRGAIIHIAQLIGATGIVENPLGKGCLTCIDMGDDSNIPDLL